uniref:NADP-dependent oxidoreductase domain-containing protein n=1 Tax=Aegilops tauschii subsp. strangulata TaxID=200361 RepID=A0A453BNG3_AEGTS
LDGLADAYEQGLVKAVGVSNYNEKRLRDAHARLKKRGVPLAVNQVNYSLIYRTPEENGVKAACDELGVTLIAYSPIAQEVFCQGNTLRRIHPRVLGGIPTLPSSSPSSNR